MQDITDELTRYENNKHNDRCFGNYCRFKEGCDCGQHPACKDCGYCHMEGHHQSGCLDESLIAALDQAKEEL